MKVYIVHFVGMTGRELTTEIRAKNGKDALEKFDKEWNDGQVPDHKYMVFDVYNKDAPLELTPTGFIHKEI